MKIKNAKEIAKIDRQLDRLEAEFLCNSNRMKSLSDEGMRGCSEYWRIHRESVAINDQIRDLLQELWKLQDEE